MRRRGILAALAMLAVSACAIAGGDRALQGFKSERIAVVTRGSGPDVILIHGMNSHAEIWNPTVAALERRYRLHLVQIYGFGGVAAEGNADGPVAAPVAEEIARYLFEANVERPAVIGHSMGGTIGMMLTLRHPQAVGRLMVVDMSPFMGAMFGGANATPTSVGPIANNVRAQMRAAPQGEVTPILEQTIASMVGDESARTKILGHARDSIVGVTANAFHELIVTDLRPELESLRQALTVLYVIPPNLPMPPDAYERYIRSSYANAPHARIVRIDESRHFIMIDQFERFISEVESFLAAPD